MHCIEVANTVWWEVHYGESQNDREKSSGSDYSANLQHSTSYSYSYYDWAARVLHFSAFIFNFDYSFRSSLTSVSTFLNMIPFTDFVKIQKNTQIRTGHTLTIPLIYRSAHFGWIWSCTSTKLVSNFLVPRVQCIFCGEILGEFQNIRNCYQYKYIMYGMNYWPLGPLCHSGTSLYSYRMVKIEICMQCTLCSWKCNSATTSSIMASSSTGIQ